MKYERTAANLVGSLGTIAGGLALWRNLHYLRDPWLLPLSGAWLDNLIDQVQPLYLSIERYARVFRDPDPARMRAYGVDTEFYRADDPVVVAARAVHRGRSVAAADLERAIAEGSNHGGYGMAVALGLRSLRQASDFWEHRSEELPDVSQG